MLHICFKVVKLESLKRDEETVLFARAGLHTVIVPSSLLRKPTLISDKTLADRNWNWNCKPAGNRHIICIHASLVEISKLLKHIDWIPSTRCQCRLYCGAVRIFTTQGPDRLDWEV
jgi:hypothetical protein